MMKIAKKIIEKYNLNPNKIFLVDGLGATVSAMLLALLLANYENIFGVKKQTAYYLAIPIFVLMIYSLGCYILNLKTWKPFLRVVIVANLFYCLLTSWIIIKQFETLTIIGVMYFIGEISIICFIVNIEIEIIKKFKNEFSGN